MSNTLDGTLSLRDPTMDGETVTADTQNATELDAIELDEDERATLIEFCKKHELSVEPFLASVLSARKKQCGVDVVSAPMVDAQQAASTPALSPRKVIIQVRQKQAVPLNVAPLTDDEWQVLSPHMFCQSRTLARREMLYRALRFACGHAQSKNAYDCSMAAWLAYEITRYHGTRIRAMVEAARGLVSDERQRELEGLSQYAEQRAAGRARFED